jgi:hypothetical protein
MEQKDLTGIVPEQYTGKEIIAEAKRELSSTEEAKQAYLEAKARLLDVNNWSALGLPGTNFQVLDSDAEEAGRPVQEFDYFRISIPGPGSKEGDGFDWVYVEEMKEVNEDEIDSIAFRVRPTSNPDSPNNETAHFYSSVSTSTFMVTRENNLLRATIFDRNIKANDESTSLADDVRNKIYAMGGISGMSKLQWEILVGKIVEEN